MTPDKLRTFVAAFSNAAWVRYWLNWPAKGQATFTTMALSVRESDGSAPAWLSDTLQPLGFRTVAVDGLGWIWTIGRTNDDGTPYTGGA